MGAAVNLLIGGPSLVYCVIFALLRTDLVERGTKMCASRLRGSSKNGKGGVERRLKRSFTANS
jgi:hypothetical protein